MRKHEENDAKCTDLGWMCVPLAVESYGARGVEACNAFSFLARRGSYHNQLSKVSSTLRSLWQAEFYADPVKCKSHSSYRS